MTIPRDLQQITETIWEVPTSHKEGMRVPARIYATEKLIREMDEAVYDQVTNVATLPGITKYALCMPDGHFGYGFPSEELRPWMPQKGSSLRAASVSISTAECGW